jgi:hypothetical protein
LRESAAVPAARTSSCRPLRPLSAINIFRAGLCRATMCHSHGARCASGSSAARLKGVLLIDPRIRRPAFGFPHFRFPPLLVKAARNGAPCCWLYIERSWGNSYLSRWLRGQVWAPSARKERGLQDDRILGEANRGRAAAARTRTTARTRTRVRAEQGQGQEQEQLRRTEPALSEAEGSVRPREAIHSPCRRCQAS